MKTVSNSAKVQQFILWLVMAIMLGGCTPTSLPTGKAFQLATSTVASTQISTPEGNDRQSKIKYLVETNGNCSLPCWWGITPGKTTWDDAEPYIASFALEIPHAVSTGQNDLTFYPTKFPNPNSNSLDDYLFAEIAVNKSGIIDYIFSSTNTSLASMLASNGVPSQIWINIVTIGTGAYTIALFYDTGVMLVYYGTNYGGNNQFITICSEDLRKANSQLWVWNSATIQTFKSIGKFGVIPPQTPDDWFRSINEVSDMQPQTFYDFYIDPSATQCIKTPWSDWFTSK
jgi:hypothetical protein